MCSISAGGTPSTKVKEYWGGNIPWMNSGDLNKRMIYKVEGRITDKGLQSSSAKFVSINSVLIGLAGQGKTRGIVAINKIELTTNQSVAFFIPEKINYKYLYFSLYRRYEELRRLSAGDGGRGGLNLRLLSNLKIKVPPLPEQKLIVKVLDVWDEVIEKLERKIEIKKNIKKGLMQRLLTGKVRLPGFSGEWKNVQIGKILDYEQPTNYIVNNTEYDNKNEIPVLTAGKTFILGYTDEKNGIFKKELLPVIIFDDFATANKFVDFPFKIKSSAMKILKNKNDKISNIKFIFESIQLLKFKIGEHKRNYLAEYQFLDIKLPGIKEQNTIAKLIQDADSEIKLLENKLNKLKNQKKYLLNNLVTGNIRTSA